jgi:hypothetical protein
MKKGQQISPKLLLKYQIWVNLKWIMFCSTGYFLSIFSSLLKKREEEKGNEVAKPVKGSFSYPFSTIF